MDSQLPLEILSSPCICLFAGWISIQSLSTTSNEHTLCLLMIYIEKAWFQPPKTIQSNVEINYVQASALLTRKLLENNYISFYFFCLVNHWFRKYMQNTCTRKCSITENRAGAPALRELTVQHKHTYYYKHGDGVCSERGPPWWHTSKLKPKDWAVVKGSVTEV